MKRIILVLLILMGISSVSSNAQSITDSIQELDSYLLKVMEDWRIPSMAIGVVKGEQIVFLKGYGYRDWENKIPVDENTLFPVDGLGDFHELTIGVLQDQGKFSMDEPLNQFLPELKMYDDYVTNKVNLRDFMTYKTGLPNHGFLWYGTDYSRKQIIEALQFLDPVTGFREPSTTTLTPYVIKYAVDKISGVSYENFMRKYLFDPLEMHTTCFGFEFETKENVALPYTYDPESKEFKLSMDEFRNVLQIYNTQNNPGIFTNASEICNWMIMRLNDGIFQGNQIVSSDFISQSHSLQAASGTPDYSKGNINIGRSLGSFIDYFHGYHLVSSYGHKGMFDSRLMLFPQQDLGIIVMTGSTFSGRWIIAEVLAEKILLGKYRDWNQVGLGIPSWVSEMKERPELERPVGLNKNDPPSLELSAYVGTYINNGYGKITITEEGGQIKGVRSVTSFDLDHIGKDQFKLHAGKNYISLKTMQFHPDNKGVVNKLTIDYESKLPPIEFIREQ